jgi:hypothetical protein
MAPVGTGWHQAPLARANQQTKSVVWDRLVKNGMIQTVLRFNSGRGLHLIKSINLILKSQLNYNLNLTLWGPFRPRAAMPSHNTRPRIYGVSTGRFVIAWLYSSVASKSVRAKIPQLLRSDAVEVSTSRPKSLSPGRTMMGCGRQTLMLPTVLEPNRMRRREKQFAAISVGRAGGRVVAT